VAYYDVVKGGPSAEPYPLRARVLVVWVARPFYSLARRHPLGRFDPQAFGLLMSNSLFTATEALLLLRIGTACVGNNVALTGVLLRPPHVSLLRGFVGCFTNYYFWLVFVFLLPLGLIRLRAFPAAWVWASAAGVAAAVAMGTWNNARADTVPSMFNSAGPILSLSVALFFFDQAKGHEPAASWSSKYS
jgi:hypothetical protein